MVFFIGEDCWLEAISDMCRSVLSLLQWQQACNTETAHILAMLQHERVHNTTHTSMWLADFSVG